MAVAKPEAFVVDESDHVVDKKREIIGSQIAERKLNRLADNTKKHADRAENTVAEEKTPYFRKSFQKEHDQILIMLKCEDILPDDRWALNEHFDAVTISFQRLQKFFNDSVLFLNSHESRRATKMLSSLQEEIAKRRNAMLPKKKFAFKSKVKKGENKKSSNGADSESALQKYNKTAAKYQGCEVSSKTGETITLDSSSVNQKDISISNLISCKVYLLGAPSTVHISNVDKCTIAIGPVSGSVFVDRCTNSEIATSCQQLRVHHTNKTDFYLHVTSRAIIEDTTQVRFAPYNFTYEEQSAHSKLSGIDLSAKNSCNKVDDFNWLAMDTASPNWSELDLENRRCVW